MAKAPRSPRAGVSYVTLTTGGRRPIFEISRIASLFAETLLHFRTQGLYKLHAYVVLPARVHLLLTPQNITLDQAVYLIRQGFADRLDSDVPLWEDDFTAQSIANIRDLEVARAYLHQTPVTAKLVASAELYPYSSAFRTALSLASPLAGRIRTLQQEDDPDGELAESSPPHLRKVAS